MIDNNSNSCVEIKVEPDNSPPANTEQSYSQNETHQNDKTEHGGTLAETEPVNKHVFTGTRLSESSAEESSDFNPSVEIKSEIIDLELIGVEAGNQSNSQDTFDISNLMGISSDGMDSAGYQSDSVYQENSK